MANIIDLTGKLGIAERPAVVIDGVRYEVDDSAKSVLQLVALISGEVDTKNVRAAYELLFDAPTRKRLDKLNLSFADFVALINAAMTLVYDSAGGEGAGEAPTPATR